MLLIKKIQEYIKNGSKGDLDLMNTPITSLPDDLTVNGNLDLEGTPITSLPDNLKINGYLDLSNTPISKKYSKKEIRKMAPLVKGEIYI